MLVAFHKWHEKFEVAPSIDAYDKIVSICCDSSKVILEAFTAFSSSDE
jgi:hypothetical protein